MLAVEQRWCTSWAVTTVTELSTGKVEVYLNERHVKIWIEAKLKAFLPPVLD
jgi:hypothetical protein